MASSSKYATFLKAFSIFALATGSLDTLLGTDMVISATGPTTISNPQTAAFIDSQLRFLGTIWAGYGAMLWWASNDIPTRRVPLGIMGAVMFAGGIGRVLSGWKLGYSGTFVKLAAAVELGVPPLLYALGL